MKTVLIISSFVSASHVGAGNSAFCLQRLGVETAILPTTLFGRHPGWGAPGGEKTSPELLRSIWQGIAAQNLKIDGVLTGYMGHPDHVALAVEIITELKSHRPNLTVLVDPVMGDQGHRYVGEPVAEALMETLLPLADLTTPNLWELEYISGDTAKGLASIEAMAAKSLPCPSVITSVPFENQIGALLNGFGESAYVSHPKFEIVPNGGGDALAGTFFAHHLNGVPGLDALSRATSSIFEILKAANAEDLGELPLIRKQDALFSPPPLPIKVAPYD